MDTIKKPHGIKKFGTYLKSAFFMYAQFVLLVFLLQRFIMYFPQNPDATPKSLGAEGFKQVSYITKDNVRIKGWYRPAEKDKPTLLYFHGNGDLAVYSSIKLYRLTTHGYGLFLAEFRGYDGNEGKPRESSLIDDGEIFFNMLHKRFSVPKDKIVLYGHSLGSGIAVALAERLHAGGLILESAYSSVLSVASKRFWFLPVRFMLKEPYRSDLRIKNVTESVLFLHGTADSIIPIEEGRTLYSMAGEPKKFITISGGKHMNLYQKGALTHIHNWLEKLDGESHE